MPDVQAHDHAPDALSRKLKSVREDVTWHLHDTLFWPLMSLGGVVLYRIVYLCTALFQATGGRSGVLTLVIFFLRVTAAGLWFSACIHRQFHLICCLAFFGEASAFMLARAVTCQCTFRQFACGIQPIPIIPVVLGVVGRLSGCVQGFLPPSHRRPGQRFSHARTRRNSPCPSPMKTGFLLYLCCVDATALHVGSVIGFQVASSALRGVQGVQLMAHGFHEGRPVFSTGTIPPAQFGGRSVRGCTPWPFL